MKIGISRAGWIALAIFAFALALRVVGIGWGLKNDLHNQSYHPDEPVILAYSQQIEPTKFDFTPGFYNYGTLYLTMLKVASDVTTAYTGAPEPEKPETFWDWMSRVHLAGRILSALAGAGTAVLLFFLASRFLGTAGGLAAGLAIAVAPGHVIHSRFQTVDVIAVFFLAASALLALKLLPPPRDRDEAEDPPEAKDNSMKLAIAAGAMAGLSAGTKYTGILALLTLYVAIAYAYRNPKGVKLAVAGTLAALVVFIVATPGVLLDTAKFMQDFKYEMTHTSTGHGLIFTGTSSGFLYHLSNLFAGMGILLTLIGVGGLVAAAVKKHPWAIALLVFFVAYYFLIGRAEVKFLRYTFPLYIGIAAGFAYVFAKSQKSDGWKRAGVAFGILAIGGIDAGGLTAAAKSAVWMADVDPRDRAAVYIKSETAKDAPSNVGYARDPWFWSVPLFPDATIPRMPMGDRYVQNIQNFQQQYPSAEPWMWSFYARMALMQSESDAQGQPVLYYHPVPAELGGTGGDEPLQYKDFDSRLVTEIKPTFVTFTSLEAGAVARLAELKSIPQEALGPVKDYNDFIAALQKDYTLVKRYVSSAPTVEDIQYVQPYVFVWKRKSSP